MSTDLILFLAVCAASALVARASMRDISEYRVSVDPPAPWRPKPLYTLDPYPNDAAPWQRMAAQAGRLERPAGAEAHW